MEAKLVAVELASELIGSSFFNDKDEEIGSLGDIVIDQKKASRS